MKKVILLVLVLLIGCSNKFIINKIGVDGKCKIKNEIDTHGGFNGDGDYFVKIECNKINNLKDNWKNLPLTDSLKEVMEMEQCDSKSCKNVYKKYNIPNIKNGYYYFIDKKTNSSDEVNINNKSSYNFILALLDKDTNMIYYYELDT